MSDDSASSQASRKLSELEAEARYASDRYRLYKARVMGPSQTSPARLHELERADLRAAARLQRAKSPTARLLESLPPVRTAPSPNRRRQESQ
jgi:hypothetical protein